MRHLLKKEKKNRKLVYKLELECILNKALTFNINIPLHVREAIYSILYKYGKNNKSYLRWRCVFTNKSRSIFTKFKISRLMFKRLVIVGKLPGIWKKTW